MSDSGLYSVSIRGYVLQMILTSAETFGLFFYGQVLVINMGSSVPFLDKKDYHNMVSILKN